MKDEKEEENEENLIIYAGFKITTTMSLSIEEQSWLQHTSKAKFLRKAIQRYLDHLERVRIKELKENKRKPKELEFK